MSDLTKVSNQDIANALGGMCLTKGVLAINAASAATVKTTNALVYGVAGVLYTKAALAAYVQPINTTALYVLALNAAGTVAVVQGTYAGQQVTYGSDLSKIVTAGYGVPTLPAGYTPIGAIKVATNGSATFTAGTTALDAAGVTATYFDLALLPVTL